MARKDKTPEFSALPFLPAEATLASLRTAAAKCEGCPLFAKATQTVFGEGRKGARIVLVGEQPGNDEDLEGKPFIGPAGKVLDKALEEAGIDRADAYVTNVVKHFKWEPQGKRRLHKKPGAREIAACLPWLEKEIEIIEPEVLVCLGATAAQALLGKDFKVTQMRGKFVESALARHTLATIHPSSILRMPSSADRERALADFVADLTLVAKKLKSA